MKKILKAIIIIGIIVGLGFGGYWLYRKFTGANIVSELEKVEMNPDERKELVEKLTTKDEKIDMVIQLVEDINQHKISYNYPKISRFYVENKYEIDYEVSPYAAYERDYIGRPYIAGAMISCILRFNNSKDVYVWGEYKNSIGDITGINFTDKSGKPIKPVVVDLGIEDELILGKGTMQYKNQFETEFTKELEDFKTNRKYITLKEEDGIFTLESNVSTIETDGISYIKNSQWYLELNNKELYERLIKPIENVKSFPSLDLEVEFDSLTKYDRQQLLKEYIASIEPKNQVWSIDNIDDFYFSEGFSYTKYYGKIESRNSFYMSGILSSASVTQNLISSIDIIFKEPQINDFFENGIRTIEIKLDKNAISSVSKGEINEYLLELVVKIDSDDSFTVNYKTHLDIVCDKERIVKDCSIVENGKFINNKIDETTLISNSKLTLKSYSFIDANNNEYSLNNEKTYNKEEEYSILFWLVEFYIFK